jgi:outer membrane receptor protein involved in Fe transport
MPKFALNVGCLSVLMLFLMGSFRLFGQVGASGTITGLVTDSTGAVIPGAKVVLMNTTTGISRGAVSGDKGYFTFTLLSPSQYAITVEKVGFRSLTRTGIKLEVAQTARVDLILQLGQQSEKVTVESQAPLLNTENATVGSTVGEKTVKDLPLNGRNFTQLATLSPGVLYQAGSTLTGGSVLRANGGRGSSTLFTIGGANVTDTHFDGTPLLPPPDSIQEFNLQTSNMSAAYGEGGGAVVNVELKSGTNLLHGSAYEFLRNDKFAARNFFSLVPDNLKQNQFGVTLGGPVIKNRTFFFGDYQGTRIRSSSVGATPVATAAMQGGNFSALGTPIIDPQTGLPFPGNIIPTDRLSPQATYFLPYIPVPNASDGTYVSSGPQKTDVNQFDVRVDHTIRTGDTLDASYTFLQSPISSPGPYPNMGGQNVALQSMVANVREIYTFRPNIVNEFGLSYVRMGDFRTPQGLGADHVVAAGIEGFDQTSHSYPGFPDLGIAGYGGVIGGAPFPIFAKENTYTLRDNLTLVHGAHNIGIGGDARVYRARFFNAFLSRGVFNFTGTYTGNGFADFLLGLPFSGSRGFPRNRFGGREQNQAFYVTDTWKVTRNLTVSAGLRYELIHPRLLDNHTAASFDPFSDKLIVSSDSGGNINLTTQQVSSIVYPTFVDIIVPSVKAGLPSNGSMFFLNKHDFAPRLGVAWQIGSGFVLRTGYGMFYTLEEGNRRNSLQIINPPFIADESAIFNTTPAPTTTLANMFAPITPGSYNLGPVSFAQLNPHNPNPYVQQWNFTVEKILASGINLQVGYVGNEGTHLAFSIPLNQPTPGPGPIQARRPFDQRFSQGGYDDNIQTSSYNSLQATARTRNWHGLTLLSAYAWSKSIDLVSEHGGEPQLLTVQDPNNIAAERGSSDYDLRHRFTASVIYDLPFLRGRNGWVGQTLGGWETANIITLQSGLPFTPSISTDPANTGSSKRPNRIGSGKLSNPSIDHWFDVAAFSVPAPYTYGDSRRNILTGPSFKNWDFALLKNFGLNTIRDGALLQFRAEFFNFTNTPPWGNPVTNIQSPSAGKILSAGTPRQIQFALKLMF